VVGGFDVSASAGTISNNGTGTKVASGEITHTSPHAFSGGAVAFTLKWQAPTTPGLYTLYGAGVSANNDGGFNGDGVAAATLQVNVAAANQPPIANAGGPYSANVGTPIQFNGAGSSDPDGTIASYTWNFGNGASGAGVNPSYAYSTAGTYTVTLTVIDNMGATTSATTTATVAAVNQPLPPVANPGGPYSGKAGVAVQFSGAGSSDPDGVVSSYAWSFGDGATGTGVNPMHTYATAGTYNVSLTVTDNAGLTNTASTTATITTGTTPPVANAGGPYAGTVGVPVALDGSGSTDADGTIVSYAWNFGDGATGTGATTSHTYAAAGTYSVTLTVTDNDNLVAVAQTTVTVSSAPSTSTGQQLYDNNCAACHGPGGKGGPQVSVVGASPSAITGAINSVSAMSFLKGALTSADITAISDYLNSGTQPPPPPTSGGQAAYDNNCAFCHGPNGSGGSAPSVRGASSSDIVEAINEVNAMGFLKGVLSSADIKAISGFLNGATSTPPPPPPPSGSTGEQVYNNNCAACHGPNGRGGSAEGIRGSSSSEINSAINQVSAMSFLKGTLSSGDINAVASFLGGSSRQEGSTSRRRTSSSSRRGD
jgi:PKD repeat protein